MNGILNYIINLSRRNVVLEIKIWRHILLINGKRDIHPRLGTNKKIRRIVNENTELYFCFNALMLS